VRPRLRPGPEDDDPLGAGVQSVRRLLAALLALGAAACGEAQPRGPMTDARRMYLSKCTSCHGEYPTSTYTPEQWRGVAGDERKRKRNHPRPAESALAPSHL